MWLLPYQFWCVATALTVYGIETVAIPKVAPVTTIAALQQLLPFTVLKHRSNYYNKNISVVATALTVYGIET